MNGAYRGYGVGERGFAMGELEEEVMDVFGPWFDAPGGERVRRQTGFEPIGERLRGGEVVAVIGSRHGCDFEEATRD